MEGIFIMDTALEYFLPLFVLVYFGTALLLPSYRTWKRTGVNPYVFGRGDNVHDYAGLLLRLVIAACVAVVGVYAFLPDGYAYLSPILWLEHDALLYAGIGLLLCSFLWTVIAQAQMGKSWRIGIDAASKTELVQSGIFSLLRNPVFLGMRITLLGLFLVLPNAVMLAILVAGDVIIQIQVRLEEEYLAHMHGADYAAYRKQTRRWL